MNFERIKKRGPVSKEYVGQKSAGTQPVSSPTSVYRDQGLFTDVILKFGNESIRAHKVLIGSAIPYFNNMFFSGMKEKDQKEITLKIGPEYGLESTDAIKSIINFVYDDRIELHVDTVQDVLMTARVLDVQEIVDACADFMSSLIDDHNLLEVWKLGQHINCKKLSQEAGRFLLTVPLLNKFWESTKSLEMDMELVTSTLDSDKLICESEDQVVHWLKRWIEHEESRANDIAKIFECIRFDYIEISTLIDMEQWSSVSQSLDAIRTVSKAKDRHLSKLTKVRQNRKNQKARDSYAGIIVCVGGRSQEPGMAPRPLALVEYLMAGSNEWQRLPPLKEPRRHVGAIGCEESIFVVGGQMGDNPLATVECFDFESKMWLPKQQLNQPRRGLALALLDYQGKQCIYAIGGMDGPAVFNTVERYNPNQRVWQTVANLNTKRGGVAAVTLNGEVYAMGGNDGVQTKSTVERYSPLVDRWEEVVSMLHRRAGASAAVYNGKIYVVGGFDDVAPLTHCEVYDPVEQVWTEISPLHTARGGVGLAELQGKLYAVGGHNGREYVKSVEIYLPEQNVWVPGPPMAQARAGCGVTWVKHSTAPKIEAPQSPNSHYC